MTKLGFAMGILAGVLASPAISQEIGPVTETFKATYVAGGTGCSGLLITGQFLAATPGYTITLIEASEQPSAPTSYSMNMVATPPSGTVNQVIMLTPVVYEDASFDQCPYGVTITYDGDTFVVPFSPS